MLNTLFLKHCHLTDKCENKYGNRNIHKWKEFWKGHAFKYLDFFQFVQLIISALLNMSDYDKAYPRLEMITTKRKNQLNISKNTSASNQYENEMQYLEQNN